MLNGLRYYIDKSGAKDVAHVEYAFEDISMYAFVDAGGLESDTGDVSSVLLHCSARSLDIALTLSDWYGQASTDPEYQVDYTVDIRGLDQAKAMADGNDGLVYADAIGADLRARKEARRRMLSVIRREWETYVAEHGDAASKLAFAEEHDYVYSTVLVALCDRELDSDGVFV